VTRAVRLALAGVAGLVVGALVGLALPASSEDRAAPGPTAGPDPAIDAVGWSRTTAPAPAPAPVPAPVAARPRTVLSWTTGGLPGALAAAVDALDAVAATTVVAGDLVEVTEVLGPDGRRASQPPPGMVVGLDTVAIDPATYPAFAERADRRLLRALAPGEAAVGATSAAVHGLAVGDELRVRAGAAVRVVGIVADRSVGAAGLVLPAAGATAVGVTTPRYVLARPATSAADAAAAIRALPSDRPQRVRVEGESPYLRSSDAVLPQSRIEATFGAWAYAAGPDGTLHQDPAWVAANIVTAQVPVLGEVRCHRDLIPALRGAMTELAERNLAGLVQTYDGCYNPRRVAGRDSVSRHAWGAAVDLNFGGNRTGVSSIQDDRLVDVLARWGFASGDGWLVPDPGHFEYVGPPRG